MHEALGRVKEMQEKRNPKLYRREEPQQPPKSEYEVKLDPVTGKGSAVLKSCWPIA